MLPFIHFTLYVSYIYCKNTKIANKNKQKEKNIKNEKKYENKIKYQLANIFWYIFVINFDLLKIKTVFYLKTHK